MFGLDVNLGEAAILTNKLEKLSRTAFPNVIRKTLNQTALDVKKKTLQKSAGKVFTLRNKGFFKRFSRVVFVTERRNVNEMDSEVGMDGSRLSGGSNFAVSDLEKQEYGGLIKGRSFIAHKEARVGRSWGRNPRRKNRISEEKSIAKAKGNKKSDWLKAAVEAGEGALIFGTFTPVVFRILSIKKEGGKTKVKTKPVYHIEKNRSFSTKSKFRGFSKRASEESHERMPYIYMKEAKKRFDRVLR